MKEFHSLFYKKNKLMITTLGIYATLTVLFATVLIVGSCNQYYIQSIGIMVFVLLMALRSAYFIYEKVVVDVDKKVISLRILKKKFDIQNIKSIKKVRTGQIRIISLDNKFFPISIDDEDDFISLIQRANRNIVIV